MVKRLATSPHDPLGITDSACKNQLVVVSIQYGPFNTYIPIRSTTIGKSRVAKDPITMHTSWRSNSDIASVTRFLAPTSFTRKPALQKVGGGRSSNQVHDQITIPLSVCTTRSEKFTTDGISSARWPEQVRRRGGGAWVADGGGRVRPRGEEVGRCFGG
ncbi:hypothetical protein F511_42066 [Dorcoceras hygrometricum]|uniref:Carboxyl-terminal-processing peptidase 1, chloroplastic n=1 Tax=Dorcoceras hygrometricum TaxID=472368 RepID=A0A2Z7A7H6_9LAMI|nr:hypothetical protein F511_42066 [Dorcoceras hygrometricum]